MKMMRDRLPTTLRCPLSVHQQWSRIIYTYYSLTGGTEALPTNKAIEFRVDVPSNVLYNKIKPAIIAKNDEVVTAFSLQAVSIKAGENNKITYTGLEGASTIAVEDVVIDDVDYLVAQTITQQNNRLWVT